VSILDKTVGRGVVEVVDDTLELVLLRTELLELEVVDREVELTLDVEVRELVLERDVPDDERVDELVEERLVPVDDVREVARKKVLVTAIFIVFPLFYLNFPKSKC